MGDITVKTSRGGHVPLGQGIHASPWVTFSATGFDFGDVEVSLELEDRRYVVQSLTIKRAGNGGGITSELIRRIPVQRIVNQVVADTIKLWIGGVIKDVVMTEDLRSSLVDAGPTDDTLQWVARIYLMAEAAGSKPAKGVKDTLQIPTSTAGYWIRRAKDKGFMDPPAKALAPTEGMTIDQDDRG